MKRTGRSIFIKGIPFSWVVLALPIIFILITFESASGQVKKEWVARYNGPFNSFDQGTALAVDSAGNVYVTGVSFGLSGNDYNRADYATIKYDPGGNELWVTRYNGPANSFDQANAVAVDAAGNVYVTGQSTGSSRYDYATIKYDPDGNELWVARYDDTANSTDYARFLVVDVAGNVYVTGESGGSSGYDYATIKYDPDGNELWVARYDGPANSDDYAEGLAVDAAGNVYVTGGSAGSSGTDYATIKYNPDGNELWMARYDGPANSDDGATALAVDAAGNVYVTGGSAGSSGTDYATIKYDPDGNELWVARYDGPAHYDDIAEDLAVDSMDNVYVTGVNRSLYGNGYIRTDYATIKYDPDGNELRVVRYGGLDNSYKDATTLFIPVIYQDKMIVDVVGNVYVIETIQEVSRSAYATIKYDPYGKEMWVDRYYGPDNSINQPNTLAVDAAGNVYVTGGSSEYTSYDYATIKLVQIDINNSVVNDDSGDGGCFIAATID